MADEKPDPISSMFVVDDEAERSRLPEADINAEAPPDKPERERDETGKFKGKEEKAKEPEKAEKTEVKADDKAKEEKPPQTVPLATFLEKTNKLKEQLEQSEISRKEYEKRLAALEAKLNPPKEDPEPDFIEDPKGYVDHKQKKLLEAIAEANKKAEEQGKQATETATAATQQVEMQRFFTQIQSHEAQFVAANPDYYDALQHVRNVRAAQIREFDPGVTQEQIDQVIRHEETQLAVNLARQGRDPVQTAYNLAKHYGFQPKAKPNGEAKPEAKLPDIPNRRLPPDQTLGSGSTDERPAYSEGETDPIDTAIASLFKKRA